MIDYQQSLRLFFFVFLHAFLVLSTLAHNGLTGDSTLKEIKLEEIDVTAQQSRFSSSTYRMYLIVNQEDIQHLPVKTVSDLLQYIPGIDMRERGASGVQADLSMRGGTASQVKILVNGIDLTDVQTEHYAMDLPIDPMLIDRIEILQGTNFAIDAFSGAINIITKHSFAREDKNYQVLGKLSGGEYGLVQPTLALRLTSKNDSLSDWHLNTSASYNRSEGYMFNTDYKICNMFFQTGWKDIDFQLGMQMKDAGANSFYSTQYPYQFDATRTGFTSLAYEKKWNGGWSLYTHLAYRVHYDHFELFRNGRQPDGTPAPDWYEPNNHWTHATSGHLEGEWHNKRIKINFGVNARNETVRSSNLGHHNRVNVRYFADWHIRWEQFAVAAGANGTWNSQFGNDYALGVNICYRPLHGVQIFFNGNRAIRIPTFTDLYYSSPTLRSNPRMDAEKAWQLELASQWSNKYIYGRIAGFFRWGKDIIDWVKSPNPDSTIWYSTNHTSVNALGGEFVIGLHKLSWVNKIELSYALCLVQTDVRDMLSTYALDFLKHKLHLCFDHRIYKGFGATWSGTLRKRAGDYETASSIEHYQPVFLLDGKIYWSNKWLKVGIEAKNMTNRRYHDFSGILQPQHWIVGSIEFRL